ncbi:MAG: transposase [Patescibacteria group bacterium]|nr:transposase [Patescibacteria group bacterium]
MPVRKIPLVTNEYYHIFNRGFNKQKIFISPSDYQRVFKTIQYYHFLTPPIKFSYLNIQPLKRQNEILNQLVQTSIDILAFCFMPNHFHFLVKQIKDGGILNSISKFSLSYSKYFNTFHEKNGPVFEGRFKAIRVSSNEQLLHLSRYIHLNPYTASIVKNINQIQNYPYSSLKEYLHPQRFNLSQTSQILKQFKSPQDYLKFIKDHADYQKQLHLIKEISVD